MKSLNFVYFKHFHQNRVILEVNKELTKIIILVSYAFEMPIKHRKTDKDVKTNSNKK